MWQPKDRSTQLRWEIDRGSTGDTIPYTQALIEDIKLRGRKRYEEACDARKR